MYYIISVSHSPHYSMLSNDNLRTKSVTVNILALAAAYLLTFRVNAQNWWVLFRNNYGEY